MSMADKNGAKKNGTVRKLNLIPRIVCFVFAFIMWIYVMVVDSPDYEQRFDGVPVDIVGATALEKNSSFSVFSASDITVDVTVKGQKSVISRYSKDDIKVEVDVSGITDGGKQTLPMYFDLPSGLSLVSSSQSTVDLFVDRKVTLEFDVKPKLSSYKLGTDYELGQITCNPQTVRVEGPDSLVGDVSGAAVDIDMNGADIEKSFVLDGAVYLNDANGDVIQNRYLKLSQSSVSVSVPVYTYKDLTLTAQSKYGYFNENNSKLTFDPPTVRVKGEPSKLAALDNISVTTIDEKTVADNTTYLVDIVLPEGITLADGESSSVNLTVKRVGMSQKVISVKNISVNAPKDMDYELLTNSVAVTIVADSDIISDITASDITLSADLSSFANSSGNVMVPVTVEFKDVGGTAFEFGTYNIQVIVG